VHQGIRKNCWTIWHTHRRIELRVTNAPAQSGENDCNEGTAWKPEQVAGERTVQHAEGYFV
jgi:hypothetical protein